MDFNKSTIGEAKRLIARPATRDQAKRMVAELHRHHDPVAGYRFAIAAYDGDKLVGVCVVGRPVATQTEQYRIAEVTRLVTDGTKNACSFLYSRAARAAEAMGFDSIQTFILESEPGTSLRAAGWLRVPGGDPKGSSRQNRPGRSKKNDGTPKQKWARDLRPRRGP